MDIHTLPKLSIITPSYNQGAFIEQTINSVLSQNYPQIEYIVMDGGSTDNTLGILRKYESWLTWISEKDHGQSNAINKGLRQLTGEVVAFINSDDLYEPGALLKVGQYFARHPSAAWVTGRCRMIDQQGKEIRRPITLYKNFWLIWKSYTLLQIMDFISQPATFWRRQVIDKVGLFDESLHYAMDYDYSLRVGKHYQLEVIPDYLASFRIHPCSKAGASPHAQFDVDLEIVKKHASTALYPTLHGLHNSLIVSIYRFLTQINTTGETVK